MSTQTNRKEKRECHSRNCASLQKAKWINLSEKVKLSEDTLHTASVRQKNQHKQNSEQSTGLLNQWRSN